MADIEYWHCSISLDMSDKEKVTEFASSSLLTSPEAEAQKRLEDYYTKRQKSARGSLFYIYLVVFCYF